MSSRVAKKEQRRAEREARERSQAAAERRARLMRIVTKGAIALVAAGAVAAVVGVLAGSRGVPAGAEAPFGQRYDGLEQRREAAGVSTMASPSASAHTHPKIAVWANGRRITVPADIGIDPRRSSGEMAGLHTHSDDGTIHNEGQAEATLGQFFAVWGVAFGRDRLGPYRAGRGKVVQLWIDGRPSNVWGALSLADGQSIVVSYGRRLRSPPA